MEIREKKETSSPPAPSEITRDIDPTVERVILSCISKDPRHRPASAAQVAAALPGGDPLAAALAAGETPSPEMVAASGGAGALRPWIAWSCLALIIIGIGISLLRPSNSFHRRVRIDKPPEVMAEKARDILKNLGHAGPSYKRVYRYTANKPLLKAIWRQDERHNRSGTLPAMTVNSGTVNHRKISIILSLPILSLPPILRLSIKGNAMSGSTPQAT
jgi:serine/threonine-protein kinase